MFMLLPEIVMICFAILKGRDKEEYSCKIRSMMQKNSST